MKEKGAQSNERNLLPKQSEAKGAIRQERLKKKALALRQNLRRRKAQKGTALPAREQPLQEQKEEKRAGVDYRGRQGSC